LFKASILLPAPVCCSARASREDRPLKAGSVVEGIVRLEIK
jgi:hypothetical protein